MSFFKIFLKDFIYFIFREKGREREREEEKHQSVASHTAPTRHLAPNPGMCPGRESDPRPFSGQASTQPTEPQRPGLKHVFKAYLLGVT